jgi:hypothetical protein
MSIVQATDIHNCKGHWSNFKTACLQQFFLFRNKNLSIKCTLFLHWFAFPDESMLKIKRVALQAVPMQVTIFYEQYIFYVPLHIHKIIFIKYKSKLMKNVYSIHFYESS